VYVGDANNAAAAAAGAPFYHADDAAGTIPNTLGVYLILPDSRGYVPRGEDPTDIIDPEGSTRWMGDNQGYAIKEHKHEVYADTGPNYARNSNTFTAGAAAGWEVTLVSGTTNNLEAQDVTGAVADVKESRMANMMTNFAIRY
jgi:hypothetical protein